MEIITAAFATAVAALCFIAILSSDVRDSKTHDAAADTNPAE
jgi:hypothetical protein